MEDKWNVSRMLHKHGTPAWKTKPKAASGTKCAWLEATVHLELCNDTAHKNRPLFRLADGFLLDGKNNLKIKNVNFVKLNQNVKIQKMIHEKHLLFLGQYE